MAYLPARGHVVTVTRTDQPKQAARRFHQELACAEEDATQRRQKLAHASVNVTAVVSDPILIGVARTMKGLVFCKACTPGDQRRGHAVGPDRDVRFVGGGLPSLGRRH
jgi:hypothetical protein